MWTYQGLRIREGRSWTDANGVKHPAQWSRWTEEQKIAKGLVWVDPEPTYDSRFYTGNGTPKALEDTTTEVNNETITVPGLKSKAITQTKATAGSLLSSTDWYVTRKSETGTEIPADVLTYREAVRTASGAIESAIIACTTLEDFMALYEVPADAEGNQTGNAPINDWPDTL